jgi:hypothetical protein
MKHFLTRLVERARGTAPLVEPIIAPRFAPAPAAEAAPEPEAVSKLNGDKMPAQPDNPSLPPLATREGEPAPPRGDAAEAPIEVVQETLLVPPGIPDAPAPFVIRQTKLVEHDAAPARSSAIKSVRAYSRAQPLPPLWPQPVKARQPPPISSNDDSAEPPIVKVTIGRIEVRTAPAPAAPSRKTAPSSGLKLTLDAYLKSRKEGAR